MALIRDPRERTRFLKFASVGVIGFGVDSFTFNLISFGLGVAVEISSVISFFVAVINNFLINRYWTYPDSRSKKLSSQLAQYGAVSISGLLVRIGIFGLVQDRMVNYIARLNFNLPFEPAVIGSNITLAIAVIIVMSWNFFINRFWTFNDVD